VLAKRLAEVVAMLRTEGLSVILSESDLSHSRKLIDVVYTIDRGQVTRRPPDRGERKRAMKTVAAVLRAVSQARPYGESRPMVLEEVELGAPRAGELLVRIEAAGVCHSDISVVDGSRVRPLPMALGTRPPGWSSRSARVFAT